jgi:AraC family transcriptional regulator
MSIALEPGQFLGALGSRECTGSVTLSHISHSSARVLPQHDHAHAYFSLLLKGWYRERTLTREIESHPYTASAHPTGFSHCDEIGPEGAEFFIIEVQPDFLSGLGLNGRLDFCLLTPPAVYTLVRLRASFVARALAPMEAEVALAEMASHFTSLVEPSERGTPAWLARCVEIMEEEKESAKLRLTAIAQELGLNPVHVSRTFKRCCGYGIVGHFTFVRLRRAANAIAEGKPLADAALIAGFADQSHMTRTMKRFWGLTPRTLRSLA